MSKFLLSEVQIKYLLENIIIEENNKSIPIGSWVRTKTEEFQVVKNDNDGLFGKSFCNPDKIVKINHDEIVDIKSSEKNKMTDINNISKLDFSKYYQMAGLNEIKTDRQKYLKGKNVILFLDDSRNPFTSKEDWISKFSAIGTNDIKVVNVETLSKFINHIETYGLPSAIIFDNDLGKKDKEGGSGCLAAAWLVKYCITNNLSLPKWSIISANKYGRCCIGSVLRKFESLKK